jgi:hypothetical protein
MPLLNKQSRKITECGCGGRRNLQSFLTKSRERVERKYTHMNKNAYEIRLEVLQMAHSTVWNQYLEKLNIMKNNTDKANQFFDETLVDGLAPKTTAVLSYAAELYEFVEGK